MSNLDPALMTEDEVLSFTRSKRMALANELTKNGIPTERETAGVLLQTLDGLDRSSLTRLKIKADEKANKNNENAAAIIAQMLGQIGSSKIYQMDGVARREPPQLSDAIPVPEVVEGEMETNPGQMDFDTFTEKFGSTAPDQE